MLFRHHGSVGLLAPVLAVMVLFGLVQDSGAQQTTGSLIYNFDANADQVLDDGWESTINSGERDWEFTSDTRVGLGFVGLQNNTTIGDLHGISGRINFPRTSTELGSPRDNAGSLSYNDSPKFAEGDATWEFWIRLDNNTDPQIIWESGGGGDGSAILVNSGEVQWVIKDGGASQSISAAISTGEYHHVVAVYDRDDTTVTTDNGTADTMTLYIDGVQISTTRDNGALTNMQDWDGGDDAGLGGGGSDTGFTGNGSKGGTGGALGSLDGYRNLDGQIAAYRFYNSALTQAELEANIEAVAASAVYFDGGASSTDWGSERNWDTNLVPSQNQDVTINAGQTAVISADTSARVQTLFIGNDGVSSLAGYATDGVTPADGNGVLEMNGGTLRATQIILGNGDNQGTFNFTDGTITVNKGQGTPAFAGQQAFHIGFSGTGTTNANVFTMGTSDQSTSPTLNVSGGRFEIGENGNAPGGTRINATFNMRSGTLNVNGQNLILGQGGIADASDVIFNLEGGTVNIGADFNINDGTAQFTQTGGFVSMRDLQTQNNAASTDTLQLNGGVFEIRDDMNDRAGTSTLNLAGGRLEFDAVVPGAGLREVENINFSSGTIEFSIRDAAEGFTPLTVGVDGGNGVFSGTGQIEVELDNIATGTATGSSTTWTGASGTWTTTNTAEWDSDNPIQYLLSGTAFDLIVPNAALTTMTDLGDLTAVGSDWTLSTRTEFNADDTLVITAANDIGLTPIKAIINATGETITRNSDLLISAEAGGDAAGLDVLDGTLDLSTSGSDIQIGGEAVAELLQTGGVINANNLTFGGSGGTLSLEGGTFNLDGVIVEGALGAPDAGVSNAQLHIDGGTLNVAGDSITVQRFAVGNDTGTTGTYTATKKAVVATGTTSIGSSGNGTYVMEGSSHTASNFTIGEQGTGVGVVTQRGGRVETVSFLYAGQNGDGTYTMERYLDVGIPELVVGNTLIVGTNGTGRFDILDGRLDINAGGFDVAENPGSSGTVNVGSSAGVYNPFITISGGNFETALDGIGTVNFLSGRVLQETNNLITGQTGTSTANVTFGGGQGKFVYDFLGNSEWNTNDGQGNVDVLKNATINTGRNLNLGTGGALDLHINGGAVNVGVNNTGADLNYRNGTGTTDSIRVTDGLLTVADDFLFNQGTGRFQVDGSGNKITVGDAYLQGATSTLVARIDPLGLSPIEVTGDATFDSGSILDIDETIIGTVAPNSATTYGTAGAWDGLGTNWDKGNPSAAGISTNDRVVVLTYGGTLTDNGLALDVGDTNWTLDTSVGGEIAVIAQTDFGTAPVHAILDSDGVTTRATNLVIDASGAAADAAGLTVTASDTLTMAADTTLTVQGGATLAGEGVINTSGTTGETIIASGAFLSSGATDTGLVGGGSSAGTLTFNGDLTLNSGSTWLVDIVDATTADFLDVNGELSIAGANLQFGGFTPDPHTTYAIAEYTTLVGTFSGLADGTRINGYEINYGTKAGFSNQITLTAVPEPTTIIPMILGALAGGFFLRRRKRQAVS